MLDNTFYTYCTAYGNTLLYRGYENGEQVVKKESYSPYLFVEGDGEYKSFYGNKPLAKKKFDKIKDAKDFINKYSDVHGFEVHGYDKFHYQFLAHKFKHELNPDQSNIRYMIYDIEVISDNGFPDIEQANEPVVLISVYNSVNNELVVFGLKDHVPKTDQYTYYKLKDENSLLRAFIAYQNRYTFDFWSGWNIDLFDTIYMLNRINKILGEDYIKQLSPFGVAYQKNVEYRGKDVKSYEICGIISLDYLQLYKKFTYTGQPEYSLGYISGIELNKKKVELSGISFRDNYENHTDDFIYYNAIDTLLVKELDDKMKLFELIFIIGYLMKCNISDVFKTVAPWECFIHSVLLEDNIIFPPRHSNISEEYVGGFVQDIEPSSYTWMMTFDFSSLYPSIIRQWNISPETYRGIGKYTEPLQWLENQSLIEPSKGCSIAANGAQFSIGKIGILPKVLKFCMDGRKVSKKKMLEKKSELQKSSNKVSLEKEISSLNNRQMALKYLANSLYGCLGTAGFIFYDKSVAEAVTTTGQYAIQYMSGKIDRYLKEKYDPDVNYIPYNDTDSSFVDCALVVERHCVNMTNDEIVDFLDKYAESTIQPIINSSMDTIYDNMNGFEKILGCKREAISSKSIFMAKKRYAMYVHDSESVKYDPPTIKITGIEIVRSSTPAFVRKHLNVILERVFTTNERDIQKYVKKIKTDFLNSKISDIAFPRGVSDIDKYKDKDGYKSGCPIHVRSAIVYNKLIKGDKTAIPISNGDKIRFIYLKSPNPVGENVIGFLPADEKSILKIGQYIDYELQWEKSFIEPLKKLLVPLKWEHEPTARLNFGD